LGFVPTAPIAGAVQFFVRTGTAGCWLREAGRDEQNECRQEGMRMGQKRLRKARRRLLVSFGVR
jgi:hypothetical protein